MTTRALSVIALLLAGVTSTAHAHLRLTSPPSRYGGGVLKDGPCGRADGTRSSNVTVFEPGQTIEVVWEEYIDHPGHFRIAFDADGDDDFVDPATMMELDSNDAVLMDGIEDRAGSAEYRVTVTLPDVECDNCTLQVIQVMYDKPPYTVPGNDIYYQCADLVLRAAEGDAGTTGDDAGASDGGRGRDAGAVASLDAGTISAGGGCEVAPHGDGGLLLLGGLLFAAVLRRARRDVRASGP